MEFGADALVEHLPGVAGGSRWLGTFDRDEAVEKEELDFFASGHALVEGVYRELEDGPRGRVALLALDKSGVSTAGLLFALRYGMSPEFVAVSLDGREQPAWAELILARRAEVRGIRPEDWTALLARASRSGRTPDWPGLVRGGRARAGKIRVAARTNGDERGGEGARPRIQLRVALGGYETAVRFLRTETWPEEPVARVTLDLVYASTLVAYENAYSWEIAKRETVSSSLPPDLTAWTKDQIFAEAARAYADARERRDSLGTLPVKRLDRIVEPNDYPEGVRGDGSRRADVSLRRPSRRHALVATPGSRTTSSRSTFLRSSLPTALAAR